jgi:hypothetical protein
LAEFSDFTCTGSEEAKKVLIEAADSLVDRFNPTVGLIRSWDAMKHQEGRPRYDKENMDDHLLVIIDNMVSPLSPSKLTVIAYLRETY